MATSPKLPDYARFPITSSVTDYWARPDSHRRLWWAVWILWVAQRRLGLAIITIEDPRLEMN